MNMFDPLREIAAATIAYGVAACFANYHVEPVVLQGEGGVQSIQWAVKELAKPDLNLDDVEQKMLALAFMTLQQMSFTTGLPPVSDIHPPEKLDFFVRPNDEWVAQAIAYVRAAAQEYAEEILKAAEVA
jgi:hypothetical protein